MPHDSAGVLAELGWLARERGWTDVVTFVDALPAAHHEAPLLVAPSVEVDPSPLLAWMTHAAPGIATTISQLELLARDMRPTLMVNRVVAVFECGRLLTPEAVEAATAVLTRPPASYAVVLAGASAITDKEDLELVERGVWRLLVRDPQAGWAGQDLTGQRCFLWSAGQMSDLIAPRVARDREMLAGWLRSTVPSFPELERLRALYALDLAEASARRTPPVPGGAEQGTLKTERIIRARSEVGDLHQRMLQRLDADTGWMERQLAASLQTLQQDLLGGAGVYLDRYPASRGSASARQVKQAVMEYVMAGARQWRGQALKSLLARRREMTGESENLLAGVDWALVNTVAPRQDGKPYPAVLVHALASNPDLQLPDGGERRVVEAEIDSGAAGWNSAIRMAVAGAMLAASVGLVMGPKLLPVASAAALGAAGAGLLGRYRARRHSAGGSLAYARAEIAAFAGAALPQVRQRIDHTMASVRAAVDGEFKALGDVLDRVVREVGAARPAAKPAAHGDPDRAQLAALRRRLAGHVSSK